MKNIIVDTGFILALHNQNNHFHDLARKKAKEYPVPLVTTWPVITETCYLLLTKIGSHAQEKFIESLEKGALIVYDLEMKDFAKIYMLVKKYNLLPMDLADASLVLLAEKIGHGKIFSTDERDFNVYRWKNYKPFENLLLH